MAMEDIPALANRLIELYRKYETAKSGKVTVLNPVTGAEITITISEDELDAIATEFNNVKEQLLNEINNVVIETT